MGNKLSKCPHIIFNTRWVYNVIVTKEVRMHYAISQDNSLLFSVAISLGSFGYLVSFEEIIGLQLGIVKHLSYLNIALLSLW